MLKQYALTDMMDYKKEIMDKNMVKLQKKFIRENKGKIDRHCEGKVEKVRVKL